MHAMHFIQPNQSLWQLSMNVQYPNNSVDSVEEANDMIGVFFDTISFVN